MTSRVRHRRRPPRSRDEMRAAIEARIREQDRLGDETEARLRAALAPPDARRWGAHARPRLAGWLRLLDRLRVRRMFCSQCSGPITARHRRGTCSPDCADQQTIDEGV